MNPADWGSTPLANGAVRGAIAAIITGILAALYEVQRGTELRQAAVAGAIPMLVAFLGLLGFGVLDQNRANAGVVNPSDVPVQIATKTPIFGDMAPGQTRDAKIISTAWTLKAQRDPHRYGR